MSSLINAGKELGTTFVAKMLFDLENHVRPMNSDDDELTITTSDPEREK